jgi:hypothetical protein
VLSLLLSFDEDEGSVKAKIRPTISNIIKKKTKNILVFLDRGAIFNFSFAGKKKTRKKFKNLLPKKEDAVC